MLFVKKLLLYKQNCSEDFRHCFAYKEDRFDLRYDWFNSSQYNQSVIINNVQSMLNTNHTVRGAVHVKSWISL
jgi:hypothetical protein